ncbi:IPT/TIG domain-containing protein [Cryptosporangium japonicum]|uniref:IPT/TIG domain-containing protein n=1 Tax=Cryptosporangium japonicum TaxID=80872 RepID=A0ABP3DGN1_9ACTN
MRTLTRPLSALLGGAVAATAVVAPMAPAAAAPTPTYVVGGYVPGATVVTAASRSVQIRDAEELPASVDLRADAPPVGNQGNVGACVAWTIGYSIMGYYAQGSGEPYAPLYLYMRAVKGSAPNTGLVPETALTEAQKYGVDTQSDYFQGTLNYSIKPTPAEVANASNYKITGWKALWSGVANQGTTGQLAIERALAAGNPVAIGFPVFRDFQSLKANTTYNTLSGTSLGGHMVTAYGYDSEGVWIRNQWSTAWGTKGDAKLSWAFVNKLVSGAYTVNGVAAAEKPTVPAPAVASISATSGSTVGGETVTITGSGLETATAVAFGKTTATFTRTKVDGSTRLVATVPASTAGLVDVTVTSPTGTSATSTATKYRYVAPRPTVTGLSASSSVIFGGSTVTLTGTALTGTKSVRVGFTAATAVTVTSDTTLTFVVPKVARPGAVHVVVTTSGGPSTTSDADVLTYVNPPTPVVTGLSVASGKAKASTPVTITGTDLLGASAVLLDGKRISFTAVSATQLKIVVPQHAAGSANVQVVTPGGTSAAGAASTFTWLS